MTRIRRTRIADIFFGRATKLSVAVTIGFAAATLFAPASASAAGLPWAVTADSGGTPIAKAYGDFADNGGVFATVGINYVDMSNNGSPVYVEVSFFFWEDSSTGVRWVPDYPASKQTARTQRMKYVSTELSTRLHSTSSQARAEIKVCEDRNLAYDRCSPPAIKTFTY
ncbi:hypothetical protein [Amycolatopsis orientalis]|uniref:hypothetical protein n=1 Tax=Amycolatopsis orientalis TaxID=31958 RepID=UPI001268D2AF|nr:hypothetical protein [Amycolatopsis orientalis]